MAIFVIEWRHGSWGMDFTKLVRSFQFCRHHRRFVVYGCFAPFGNQDPANRESPAVTANYREVWKEFFRSPELARVIEPSADVKKTTGHTGERIFCEHGHFAYEQHV